MRATRMASGSSCGGIAIRAICNDSRLREAGIDVAQRLKRANHETRAHEQHERERHLRDDEHVLRAILRLTLSAAAPTGPQRGMDLRAGAPQRRDEPEREPRDRGHGQRENERSRIQRDGVDAGQTSRAPSV